MKHWGIRQQILILTLLPALLIALVLTWLLYTSDAADDAL